MDSPEMCVCCVCESPRKYISIITGFTIRVVLVHKWAANVCEKSPQTALSVGGKNIMYHTVYYMEWYSSASFLPEQKTLNKHDVEWRI